jgi:hypothetical protein
MSPESAHLSDLDLAAWLDRRLDSTTRARIAAHLVECDDCRLILAESAPIATRPRRRARVAWFAGGGLVAASLALLVLARSLPVTPDQERTRGSAPVLTEDAPRFSAWAPGPRAQVRPAELRFAWGSHVPGTVYRLTVSNEQGVVVWNGRTADTVLAPPPSITQSLVPGQVYYWRVEALLPDLRTASTEAHAFVMLAP